MPWTSEQADAAEALLPQIADPAKRKRYETEIHNTRIRSIETSLPAADDATTRDNNAGGRPADELATKLEKQFADDEKATEIRLQDLALPSASHKKELFRPPVMAGTGAVDNALYWYEPPRESGESLTRYTERADKEWARFHDKAQAEGNFVVRTKYAPADSISDMVTKYSGDVLGAGAGFVRGLGRGASIGAGEELGGGIVGEDHEKNVEGIAGNYPISQGIGTVLGAFAGLPMAVGKALSPLPATIVGEAGLPGGVVSQALLAAPLGAAEGAAVSAAEEGIGAAGGEEFDAGNIELGAILGAGLGPMGELVSEGIEAGAKRLRRARPDLATAEPGGVQTSAMWGIKESPEMEADMNRAMLEGFHGAGGVATMDAADVMGQNLQSRLDPLQSLMEPAGAQMSARAASAADAADESFMSLRNTLDDAAEKASLEARAAEDLATLESTKGLSRYDAETKRAMDEADSAFFQRPEGQTQAPAQAAVNVINEAEVAHRLVNPNNGVILNKGLSSKLGELKAAFLGDPPKATDDAFAGLRAEGAMMTPEGFHSVIDHKVDELVGRVRNETGASGSKAEAILKDVERRLLNLRKEVFPDFDAHKASQAAKMQELEDLQAALGINKRFSSLDPAAVADAEAVRGGVKRVAGKEAPVNPVIDAELASARVTFDKFAAREMPEAGEALSSLRRRTEMSEGLGRASKAAHAGRLGDVRGEVPWMGLGPQISKVEDAIGYAKQTDLGGPEAVEKAVEKAVRTGDFEPLARAMGPTDVRPPEEAVVALRQMTEDADDLARTLGIDRGGPFEHGSDNWNKLVDVARNYNKRDAAATTEQVRNIFSHDQRAISALNRVVAHRHLNQIKAGQLPSMHGTSAGGEFHPWWSISPAAFRFRADALGRGVDKVAGRAKLPAAAGVDEFREVLQMLVGMGQDEGEEN